MDTSQNPGVVRFPEDSDLNLLGFSKNSFSYFAFEQKFPRIVDGFSPEQFVLRKPLTNTPDVLIVPTKEEPLKNLVTTETLTNDIDLCLRNNIRANSEPNSFQMQSPGLKIRKLLPLQQYIFSSFLLGENFVVAAVRNSGKTLGYLLPLFQGVRSVHPWGHKPHQNGPVAIIVTSEPSRSSNIFNQCRVLSRDTKVTCLHLKSAEFKPSWKRDCFHIVVGQIDWVLNFVRCRDIVLDRLAFVIFDDCDRLPVILPPGKTYSQLLLELHTDLQRRCVKKEANDKSGPKPKKLLYGMISNTLDNPKEVPLLFGEDLEEYNIILQKPPEQKITTHVVVNSEVGGRHGQLFNTKMSCLKRYLSNLKKEYNNFISGKQNYKRKTIILTRDVATSLYLVAYLSGTLEVDILWLSKDSDLVSIETTMIHWKSGKHFLLIADYGVVHRLRDEYVDYCLFYELPDHNKFMKAMHIVLNLTVQSRTRMLVFLYDVLYDQDTTIKLVTFLMEHKQQIPARLWELHVFLVKSKNQPSVEVPNVPGLLTEFWGKEDRADALLAQPPQSPPTAAEDL